MTNASNESDKTRFREIAEQAAALVPTKLVQLPLWPDEKRGAPNAILRSAVFSASTPVARIDRPRYVDRLLPVLPPFAVYYTGPQLYQPELDVCLELWHRCRRTTLGNEVTFHARSFLRSIGRHTGKSDHTWLGEAFSALLEPSVRVMARNPSGGMTFVYGGHLVEEAFHDQSRDAWYARVSPTITRLFAPGAHTWLQSSARLALGRGYLAKWLHGYYATHRDPLPISVERLRELSGSSAGRLRKFRESLRSALQGLAEAECSEGRAFAWRIDDEDMVHVRRGQ